MLAAARDESRPSVSGTRRPAPTPRSCSATRAARRVGPPARPTGCGSRPPAGRPVRCRRWCGPGPAVDIHRRHDRRRALHRPRPGRRDRRDRRIGDDVTIYQGVTLGGTSLERGKRHPTLGDRVTIGAGAKVLGPDHDRPGSRIGANAVVVRDVPPDSVVVGVPGQVIARSRPRSRPSVTDLDDALLPDLVGVTLGALQRQGGCPRAGDRGAWHRRGPRRPCAGARDPAPTGPASGGARTSRSRRLLDLRGLAGPRSGELSRPAPPRSALEARPGRPCRARG